MKKNWIKSLLNKGKRVFIAKDKNNELFYLIFFEDSEGYSYIECYRYYQFLQKLGDARIILGQQDSVYIDEISTTPPGQGLGIGYAMVCLAENLAIESECNSIHGYYFPFGEFKNKAEYFYLRNNFMIDGTKLTKEIIKKHDNIKEIQNENGVIK